MAGNPGDTISNKATLSLRFADNIALLDTKINYLAENTKVLGEETAKAGLVSVQAG